MSAESGERERGARPPEGQPVLIFPQKIGREEKNKKRGKTEKEEGKKKAKATACFDRKRLKGSFVGPFNYTCRTSNPVSQEKSAPIIKNVFNIIHSKRQIFAACFPDIEGAGNI